MPQETGTEVPNRRYGRRQQAAEGQLPGDPACPQGGGVTQPQVAATDAEAQLQPGPYQSGQEQTIAQVGMPPGKGLQQIPKDPQTEAQQGPCGEPVGGHRRSGHPSSRRSQPPGFRGSS